MIFSRLSYVPPMLPVPPMPLFAWATGYFTTSSLGTLLTTECRASYTNDLCFQSPPFSFFEVWKWRDPNFYRGKKKGEGNGVTSLWHTVRLVLRSSFISSPLIYFRTPPHGLSSSNFLYLPHFSLCYLSYSMSWLVHRNIFSPIFNSYTLSLYSNSLDEIFLSPFPYPIPPPSSPFIPTF